MRSLDGALATLPLEQRRRILAAVTDAVAAELGLLPRRGAPPGTGLTVEAIVAGAAELIATDPDEVPTQQAVADMLLKSSRLVRLRLRSEHVTWAEVLDRATASHCLPMRDEHAA